MQKGLCFESCYICSCENGKNVGSIIGDSVITCDEVIEEIKTVPTKSTSTKSNSTILHQKPF